MVPPKSTLKKRRGGRHFKHSPFEEVRDPSGSTLVSGPPENRRRDRRREKLSGEFNFYVVMYLSRRCVCIFELATRCGQRTVSFLYHI